MDPDEAGLYRKTQEYVSSTQYLPPKAEDVEHLMEHFINQMQTSRKFMHPIEFAAMSHKRLVDIHPFKDGNEIIAGLFMNLILVNAGYGITTIPSELRNEYSNALKMTQIKNNLDIDAFISFIAERVMETEKEYCRSLGIE
jgi:Fic family protein